MRVVAIVAFVAIAATSIFLSPSERRREDIHDQIH